MLTLKKKKNVQNRNLRIKYRGTRILKYIKICVWFFFFFLTFAILKANMLDYAGTQYQFLCARF